jgi:hypothetical protein
MEWVVEAGERQHILRLPRPLVGRMLLLLPRRRPPQPLGAAAAFAGAARLSLAPYCSLLIPIPILVIILFLCVILTPLQTGHPPPAARSPPVSLAILLLLLLLLLIIIIIIFTLLLCCSFACGALAGTARGVCVASWVVAHMSCRHTAAKHSRHSEQK